MSIGLSFLRFFRLSFFAKTNPRSRGKKLKQKEAFKSERKETKQGITYETAYRMTSGDDEINEDNSDAEQGEQIDGVHLFYF